MDPGVHQLTYRPVLLYYFNGQRRQVQNDDVSYRDNPIGNVRGSGVTEK